MTIYEEENDHGLAGTWNSLVWGSAGKPIACCNIRGYSIIKPQPHYEDIKKEEKAGRGLDEEHEEDEIDNEDYHDDEEEYQQEIEILTLEEFQMIFGDEIDPINFF